MRIHKAETGMRKGDHENKQEDAEERERVEENEDEREMQIRFRENLNQPRTQGICSWGAKYPGMAWSHDPRILRKMAYCLLGSGE